MHPRKKKSHQHRTGTNSQYGLRDSESSKEPKLQEAPLFVLVTTYFSYMVLIAFGHIRDFFGKRFFKRVQYRYLTKFDGYAPLVSDFESFYRRRMYFRIRDAFNRPITNVPGRHAHTLTRYSKDSNKTFHFTGEIQKCLNLSSYNYLGFAQAEGKCADQVEKSVQAFGLTQGCSRSNAVLDIQIELESLISRFLGVEDAMCVSMGFATNSTTLPALVVKGSLIISDELNHSSLVFGSRLSGATIKVFKHNDVEALETLLREMISQGQPRTHRPWQKILVIVEGLYSMEGSICNLPGILALKKKYKFYLYVDEAHSIGALGPNGGGVCDYFGVDPTQVDILMGTFTKSFGSAGGYIAGNKSIISHLRLHAHSQIYCEPMPVPVIQQIYTSMKIIMGEDDSDEGKRRIARIRANGRYFHHNLKKMGFIVYGDEDSPVVPMLLFHPAKIPAFSRECLSRNIAVVVVGYPATPIITSRVRFCLSASHTKEDLDTALKVVSEVGDRLLLKVSGSKHDLEEIEYEYNEDNGR